mmetsp:Transcript_23717/g.46247  ORF Transcript_23717/g.46247 Transcript_23717/m.46247 type:complete len:86 (+) Transcript_23717:237-494(+)
MQIEVESPPLSTPQSCNELSALRIARMKGIEGGYGQRLPCIATTLSQIESDRVRVAHTNKDDPPSLGVSRPLDVFFDTTPCATAR